MRLSVLLAAPSIALAAAVTGPESLRIPISDVISRNFAGQNNHKLMPILQQWVAENEDLDFMSGSAAPPNNLDLIHCEASGCLWESSVAMAPETIEAFKQQAKNTLEARANAITGVISTHFKTYIKGADGGLEHYITWNLLCNRLNYRGTGMVLDSQIEAEFSANDVSTKVFAYEYRHHTRRYTLQQNYGCSWFGNKCCVKYDLATVTGATMTRTSWECFGWQTASACQG